MVQLINGRAEFVIANGYELSSAMLYRGFVLAQLPSGKWEVEDMLGATIDVSESLAAARRLVDEVRGI